MLSKRVAAEALGTAFLLAAIVGSGIMASRLLPGNVGLELLINSAATGAALVALIASFGPLSGAHLNPVITLSVAMRSGFPWRDVAPYIAAQLAGAIAGVAVAHAMFGEPAFSISHHIRGGASLWLGEGVATFGLVAIVIACIRYQNRLTSLAVGCYIAAAYWFTSSTSFANPAVTLARSFSDTFAGIAPSGVLLFLAAQLIGALLASLVFLWLIPVAVTSHKIEVAALGAESGD